MQLESHFRKNLLEFAFNFVAGLHISWLTVVIFDKSLKLGTIELRLRLSKIATATSGACVSLHP